MLPLSRRGLACAGSWLATTPALAGWAHRLSQWQVSPQTRVRLAAAHATQAHAPSWPLDTAASRCTKRSLQTHNVRQGRLFLRQAHTCWHSRPGAAAAAAASPVAGVPLAWRGGCLCLPGWPRLAGFHPPPGRALFSLLAGVLQVPRLHTIGFRVYSVAVFV